MLISLIGRLLNADLPLWFTESYGFIYGIVLYDCLDKFKEWSNRKWMMKTCLIFFTSGILGVLYIKFKSVDFIGDYFLKIFLGMSLILLILMIIRRFKIDNAALRFLGSISYEVYLIHGTAFLFVTFIHPEISSGFFIILSIVITIVTAVIITRIGQVILEVIRKI